MSDTRPRRVLLVENAGFAAMLASITPADTEVVCIPPRVLYPGTPDIPPPCLSPQVLMIPTVTDALAHLRRPKREGNRAERRARGRR